MLDSFNTRRELFIGDHIYHYYSLKALEEAGVKNISRLPFTLKILLENQLRFENGKTFTKKDIQAFGEWLDKRRSNREVSYQPARVLMQDFTGVPAVVDLAAMRDAMVRLKGDPKKINPACPVDLIIDHSVQVDEYGNAQAFVDNVRIEMDRNQERYQFLKWGQQALNNFRVVPPGMGICHQVNLEYLSQVVWSDASNSSGRMVFPDTLVGTDSHTTMVNGLGVLGWGVGGIEAEAAMLGQPFSMLIPEVIGFRLEGKLKEGVTATDLVLTVTEILRQQGVVGKFVEFFGPGLKELPVADRATLGNMAPEYGATCGFFPVDEETIKYLEITNRNPEVIELVKNYSQLQGLWYSSANPDPLYTHIVKLNLNDVEPSLAGPKRPQDRVALQAMSQTTIELLEQSNKTKEISQGFSTSHNMELHHADVVIAAITSCTNTSNPSVMLGAGLLAKKAVEKGLKPKPWVKSSLAPGSKVVTDYLKGSGLLEYLEKLGFYLVGYGCTTCIGNSGPLLEPISKTIIDNDLIVSAVLSGNRNFEGRIHPLVKANWLASPPLVVAFALAGTTQIDLDKTPLGKDHQGRDVYLKDLWPTTSEIAGAMSKVNKELFQKEYSQIFSGPKEWQELKVFGNNTYNWPQSTYVKNPPYFEHMTSEPSKVHDIRDARILALLGDSVTTDHISPAGSIKATSPAGKYLKEHGVEIMDFNSYGARRGNHEVMMRGTFANIRIRNEMVPGVEGGFTKHLPDGEVLPIFDAAMKYKAEKIPLVVIAGKEYGTGSSRDWAAKGTLLLGVKAVIAESFERIHRSNLIGMGVLPLRFKEEGVDRKKLNLNGNERIDIIGIENEMHPDMEVTMRIIRENGATENIALICRIETQNELEYYKNGGILQYVLRKLSK